MALAEAARFATLLEAEIACSALNAQGVAAQVFDRHFAGVVWMNQFAIGGIRVMAPEEELEAAVATLRPAHAGDPLALQWGRARGAITGIPLALLALWMGANGWAVAVAKQRPTPLSVGVVGIYLAILALALAAAFGQPPTE